MLFACLLTLSAAWSAQGMVSLLTMEPRSNGVCVFLVTCTEWQLFLFEPSDGVLVGGAGLGPYHSLIPVIGKMIPTLGMTNLNIHSALCIDQSLAQPPSENLPPTADRN